MMEQFEKVEKLRERANVTYEEAKAALEQCNWDILDAMVFLEKEGKAKGPKKESYTTDFNKHDEYWDVKEKIEYQNRRASEGVGCKMGRLFRKICKFGKENFLEVTRHGEEILKVPVWLFAVALLFGWHLIFLIMVISLFFDCHYSFVGKEDLEKVNEVMGKANDIADKVKDEYNKL
ncbi:hypothetical protein SAMN05216249_11027 [Acetitomaculum ruminis DSM 5522]|uniref:DUF4342 domain-containing protein n=1 Tax=Acetitomaculum ruminis DSM 5522 TaxID=1120918 RepID=A0A1I0YHY2_9FIRM|nr:hypothetical protein [Acetitomaculum ruminis]SFB12821.1 hypothetical protein SAMN05216249_11027 [Acetitomaculum ruminis DSM 5522]